MLGAQPMWKLNGGLMLRNINEILAIFSLSSPGNSEHFLTTLAEASRKPAGIATELLNPETASIFLVRFVDSSLISSY